MASPFPGMNPYLEQPDIWHDFHEDLLPRLREQIAAQLPAHYVAKIDEHIYIHERVGDRNVFLGRSDVFVATPQSSPTGGATTIASAAPAQVVLPQVDIEHLAYLEIHDRRNRRIVTVVELLSPTNKYSGPDREQYLGKRGQVLRRATHFIEIDLLRGGPRMPFAAPVPACTYYALVSRMETRPQADFWPLQLADPLPLIPVPLCAPDPDAQLNLQDALHRVYDAARYANYIYESEPQPALTAAERAWAQSFLPPAP